MTTLPAPPAEVRVVTAGSTEPDAPLVVLLHGRGSDESSVVGLAPYLPDRFSYAAVRGPIDLGGAYTWFQNRGIGRPVPESLRSTIDWFRAWLATVAPDGRPVVLVGFSGGAAFAGGLLLDDPQRWTGTAVLYGTLPFDAGVPTTDGRLDGASVLVAHGSNDTVIPADLLERTWTYLHESSGATLTAHRDAAGHEISPAALAVLRGWLDALVP